MGGGLLNGNVTRPCTFQNLVNEISVPAKLILEVCAIAQQPARIAELSESEHRRQTLFRGEFGGLLDVKECQGVDQDKEPVGVPGLYRGKRRRELRRISHVCGVHFDF